MYQYQPQPMYYPPQQYSGCLKAFLYILSFLMPLPVGIIIAIVFISRPDPESKSLGNACLIISIIALVLDCCLVVLGTLLSFGGFLPFLMLPLE